MARIKRATESGAKAEEAPPSVVPTPEPQPSKHQKRRRRGRSSSERGHQFRERQRRYEEQVEQEIARLEQEVHRQTFLLNVRQAKAFRARHSVFGPLVDTVREYCTLFRDGLGSKGPHCTLAGAAMIDKQEGFLRTIMDQEIVCGPNSRGPDTVIQQWRLHTSMYQRYWFEIVGVPTILNTEANPVIVVQARASAVLSMAMVDILYPPRHRARAAAIVSKYVGVTVHFACRCQSRFATTNRISWMLVEIDHAQGLLDAGMPLEDVLQLLTLSMMSPQSIIEPEASPVAPLQRIP